MTCTPRGSDAFPSRRRMAAARDTAGTMLLASAVSSEAAWAFLLVLGFRLLAIMICRLSCGHCAQNGQLAAIVAIPGRSPRRRVWRSARAAVEVDNGHAGAFDGSVTGSRQSKRRGLGCRQGGVVALPARASVWYSSYRMDILYWQFLCMLGILLTRAGGSIRKSFRSPKVEACGCSAPRTEPGDCQLNRGTEPWTLS
jgi:hypothetical protein